MRKSFFLLLIIALLTGIVLLLPQLPQADLQKRLTLRLEQVLRQPCRIDKVSLRVFPSPAVVIQGLVSRDAALNIKAQSVALEFSCISLLKFSPEIAGLGLRGLFVKTPYTDFNTDLAQSASGQARNSFAGNPEALALTDLIRRTLPGGKNLRYINLRDANWELAAVPGLAEPLNITGISGRWQCSKRNLTESLKLSGTVAGGRGELDMNWYQAGQTESPAGEKPPAQSINRLEASGHLDGATLPLYEISSAAFPGKKIRAGFTRGFLEFDINGEPETGLRFTGKFAADNHKVAVYDIAAESEKIFSQGEVKSSLSGFLQRQGRYINIKSAALEFPGAATLFSRGLIRFSEPVFVDLVNELKVADLGRISTNLPLLARPGFQAAGSMAGELKLVGNPTSSPVLQINLKSERIALRKDAAAAPPTAAADEETPAAGIQALKLLKIIAGWDWLVKSDCQVKTLELPELKLADVSLRAEKSLTQLEIERLSARFGESGQLRLSLVMEDLLQGPHWQASLIAEKFNLKPFSKTFSMTGTLDASLVGGGILSDDSDLPGALNLNGKWRLRTGAFTGCPLFTSFADFIKRRKRIKLSLDFDDFSGKFVLRDNILRLKKMRLRSAGNRVSAAGRYFTDNERLKFKGRLIPKSSPAIPFSLSGSRQNPLFQ